MSNEKQYQVEEKTNTTSRYCILMETSGEECESWYNFIKLDGNEEALKHLEKQFERVDLYILDDLSTFDLDLENTVSFNTAKEMCLLSLNHYLPHRLFNGKLEKINFDFHKSDDNEDRIERVHELLAYGDIDNYIDGEEFFEDDCNYDSYSDSSSDSTKDKNNRRKPSNSESRKPSSSSESRKPSSSSESRKPSSSESRKPSSSSESRKPSSESRKPTTQV